MSLKEFDFWKFVRSRKSIDRLLDWAKKRSLPGFKGIPIYNIFKFVIIEATTDDISTRANSMAFSFFLALFPAIIFLFTLLPLLPFTDNYVELLRSYTEGVVPDYVETYIFDIIEGVTSIPRGGLFTLGFALSLFFSSNGIAAMLKGFEKNHQNVFIRRNYFQRQWRALKITLLLGVLFAVTVGLIVLGRIILQNLFSLGELGASSQFLLSAVRWILVIALIHAVVTLIYRYGAPIVKKFHYFSVGATVASFFIILVSLGFAYFVNNFASYNKIYGSIGALIVILVWIQISCTILLIGYEINASIFVNRSLFNKDGSKILKKESTNIELKEGNE